MINRYDILNNLETEYQDNDRFQEYFEVMDISEEQKEERVEFAEKLDEQLLFLFSLIGIYTIYGTVEENRQYFIDTFKSRYGELIGDYVDIDSYLETYLLNYSENLVDVTIRNLDKLYYLSEERAFSNACDGANDVLNYTDFVNAILIGKTKKQWVDIRDSRERKSHIAIGGKTINIMDIFHVGNSEMLFPHDTSLGAGVEEIANCRCSIKYF